MVREGATLILQSETVCFDRDLAIAMASEDGVCCTWVGVYALDEAGRCAQDSAIFSVGSLTQRRATASAYCREPLADSVPSVPSAP